MLIPGPPPDTRLVPAQGPVTGSAHAGVDELIAHHGARLDETEAVIAGPGRVTRRESDGLRCYEPA
ncbi:MAG TPA: hypothetical protein VHU92_25910 [Streptosporangiaceae bacterium]|nr:hypothetical protein [Streptosporangiaceae bacterium]